MLLLLGGTVSMLGYMSPSTAPPPKKNQNNKKVYSIKVYIDLESI